jgi:hypothetical protein
MEAYGSGNVGRVGTQSNHPFQLLANNTLALTATGANLQAAGALGVTGVATGSAGSSTVGAFYATGTVAGDVIGLKANNDSTTGVVTSSVVFTASGVVKGRIKSGVYGDGYMKFYTNTEQLALTLDSTQNAQFVGAVNTPRLVGNVQANIAKNASGVIWNYTTAGLAYICGQIGGTSFSDVVLFAYFGGTPTVIATQNYSTPPARTYSINGSGLLVCTLDNTGTAGTYAITVSILANS